MSDPRPLAAGPLRARPSSRSLAVLASWSLLLGGPAGLAAQEASSPGSAPYFPPRGSWEHRSAAAVGMDAAALEKAVTWATDTAHEGWGPDLLTSLRTFLARTAGEPDNSIIGPVRARGPVTGIVLRHGYIVREWGDPHRVDMTFSMTKSFLSTVAGLAWDRHLIRALDDRVVTYVPDSLFPTEHDAGITWDMLLRQTSEWRGTLWGKPDWVDRFGMHGFKVRELQDPGTYWEYNDVRVNLLALCLLDVWREPLPRVLKRYVMDPIGASSSWRWHGYRNTWVTIDGLRMQSVSGGGHWGGGMWISALDQARFGLLWLRDGSWSGRQLVSRAWIQRARTPTKTNSGYGFMNWFLNTDRKMLPSAPSTAFVHEGAGVNALYVDPEHDLVVVSRWMDGKYVDGLIARVLAAIRS
jgi:CubicO group peptidase (beta-lactamase class C family)